MVVVDPVCKMKLEERDVKFKSEYKGKIYYFCSLSDKRKFEENPEKYLEFWDGS
jgi:YHS domain-containing protein